LIERNGFSPSLTKRGEGKSLGEKPDHWFWTSKSITGEDLVLPEQRGRIKQMIVRMAGFYELFPLIMHMY